MALYRRGLIKSVGVVSLVDDWGVLYEPERLREGFVVTKKGAALVDVARTLPGFHD